MTKPTFFPIQNDFRKWLSANHTKETELIVGFYKVKSGLQSMTWSQSVDQALCYGWIDGVRKSIDEKSYQIRFTPRRLDSIWSPVNIKKIEELTQKGLMQKAGLDSYKNRAASKPHDYSYTKKEMILPKEMEQLFKQNKNAWDYFEALAPSYKKMSVHWVVSAVREKTQTKRLQELIAASEEGINKWKHNKYKK